MEDGKKEEPVRQFDIYQLKRLCEREVAYSPHIGDELCGYTREELRNFVAKPYRYSSRLISVMRFMYFYSGYFKKIIQYYVNLVKSDCWTVDTEFLTDSAANIDKKKLKKDYYAFVKEVGSFDLANALPKILFGVFLYDAYFGYVCDTDEGKVLFSFQPEDCVITGYTNGIPRFGVRKMNARDSRRKIYPQEIADILSDETNLPIVRGYMEMPIAKTICIKYNDGFDFLYPPFSFIIKEILDLEDFKDIEKAKAENEIYKMLSLKIPTDQNGRPTMSEPDIVAFTEMVSDIVARTIGVFSTPFDVEPIEFSRNTTNNINNVQNAIDEMYSELGVSRAMLSGAAHSAELKTSIEVDASEVYRILKQVARAVNFHCRMRLPVNDKYRFTFRFLDITAFNQNDKVDDLLKMAQASCPVKTELMAAAGKSPLKMFGNAFMENEVFELSDSWEPMQTSYTQSADSGENSEDNGRPAMDENEISDITQNTHDNESNDADNRG